MAEKEERILIARSTDYTLTDTDKGELFEGKIAPHCANVMTRQEAISSMAKAICREDNQLDSCLQCVIGFGQTPEMKEKFCKQILRKTKKLDASYMHRAEAALNSLLEETK